MDTYTVRPHSSRIVLLYLLQNVKWGRISSLPSDIFISTAWGPLKNLMKQCTDLSTTKVKQRMKTIVLKMILYFMSEVFEAYSHTVVWPIIMYLHSFYGYICGTLNPKSLGVKGWSTIQIDPHWTITWQFKNWNKLQVNLRNIFET